MKLSKTQQEVVDLMRDGWQMGVSSTYHSRCWLQKNGVGRMTDTFIGIDPGTSGAIVSLFADGGYWSAKCDETEHDLSAFVAKIQWYSCDGDIFAFIEQVSSMPGQGVSSTFKFGQSYGFLRGLLVAHDIPFETVTPSKWQREFGLIRKSKNETGTQKKNRHKAAAQRLFPAVKITHANADALLIAEYCRRVKTNQEHERSES